MTECDLANKDVCPAKTIEKKAGQGLQTNGSRHDKERKVELGETSGARNQSRLRGCWEAPVRDFSQGYPLPSAKRCLTVYQLGLVPGW